MPADKPSDAELCGRLYAALAALQKLSAPGNNHSLGRPGACAKAAEHPERQLREHLNNVVKYFVEARKQGKAEIATELFGSIPGLLPSGNRLPGDLDHEKREQFCKGRRAQEESLQKAHPALA
ncbi:hypothetical protein [Streptomyces sp. NPDC002994]|uniref:hypothetical protein n=1 Tax=Streptomyces sp. NPDC002994 TaxID=3154441 RepID=UPI0033B71006